MVSEALVLFSQMSDPADVRHVQADVSGRGGDGWGLPDLRWPPLPRDQGHGEVVHRAHSAVARLDLEGQARVVELTGKLYLKKRFLF